MACVQATVGRTRDGPTTSPSTGTENTSGAFSPRPRVASCASPTVPPPASGHATVTRYVTA